MPFTGMPAVVKINSGEGQALKVAAHNAAALPTDRESVLWLNVLDVPPLPRNNDDGANYLQVALRSRIKLLYRP